jgi:tetratricopeptide (TPR) repeat protein
MLMILILLSVFSLMLVNWRRARKNDSSELIKLWEAGAYDRLFARSGELLRIRPLDYLYLTIYGFSAYQLAVIQINNTDTLSYIDNCIWALRKAMLIKDSQGDGRVYYVLGKAYYYKGAEFADLAVKYLERAGELSFNARDIPEYLGLSYAAIRDYRSSVEAFTLALHPGGSQDGEPSDALLLSIARSYMALEEYEAARAYLVRCVESSRDVRTILTARMLLGEVLAKSGNIPEAMEQYEAVIREGGNNAEAFFQLGELYAAVGDTTRARARWREAVEINPAHSQARARLR